MEICDTLSDITATLLKDQSAEIIFTSLVGYSKWKVTIKLFKDKTKSPKHDVYFSHEIELDLEKIQVDYKIKNAEVVSRFSSITMDELLNYLQDSKIFNEVFPLIRDYNGVETKYDAIVDLISAQILKTTSNRFGL